MRRREVVAGLLALSGGAWLPGCSARRTLRVGLHTWIGYESLYLAEGFGWLPEGVLLHSTANASASLAALHEGRVEVVALTLDEVLLGRAQGLPLTAVLVFNVSAGADVLVVRPEVTELAQLAGQRVAVERSVLGELMLAKVLARAGLQEEQVEVVDLPPDRQLAGWREGRIDAAVSYEPTASLLEAEGGRRLFDSRQIPETIFDVLAIHRERIRGREGLLRGLLAAHFVALDHIRVSRQDALYRIASRQRVAPEVVQRALAGVALPGLAGNRGYLLAGSRFDQAAQLLEQMLLERDLLPFEDGRALLFDGRYLPPTDGRRRG